MVPCRNTLGALFPEVYLRDVLGCNLDLDGFLERVPRCVLSGNMPSTTTMTASYDLSPNTADATAISVKSFAVPPSCQTGMYSCSHGTQRAGSGKSSVYSPSPLSTMLQSNITNCGVLSSSSSRSSYSNSDDGSVDSTT
jgi:hypothetical protein